MEETLPPILAAFPDRAGLDELRKAGEAMREKLAKRAHAAIASQRFQKLLLEMGLALSREDWAQGEMVGDFAKGTLEKRYRSFIRGGRGIASLDAAGLHALRIGGKKLRYAAEFFSPLYPAHASRRFLAAMSELQDMLGAISDASTTSHLLDELPASEAAWLVRGWSAGGVRHRMGGMGKIWKKYKDIAPFWR
jgi:CHAD domain-containing protein